MATTGSKRNRSAELLSAIAGFDSIAIVTHDNPDPDAISAGWGLQQLISEKLKKEALLIGGGDIVRAENRHMLNLLQPPLKLVSEFQPDTQTAAILVDCGPQVAAHLLTSPMVQTVAVVDHHVSGVRPNFAFVDIRPRMAASASMVAGYLKEQKLAPGERLATAMLYAIRTETCGNEFRHTKQDRSVILWLTRFANPEWLAAIEGAPLEKSYYADLVLALQNTFVYEQSAFCLLPRAEGQEIVGEVADLLIRCQGIERVFCGAMIAGELMCSVRTEAECDSAADLVQATLKGLGHGGGHNHRAGGKVGGIPERRMTERLEGEIRERWLRACDVRRRRGTRLVPTKEIVGSLTGRHRKSLS